MKVIISAAISIDGYLDDLSPNRLILSSEEDFAEVREMRAEADAILVGAETVRKDNPSLITYSDELKELRKNKGQCEDPIKVTVTTSGKISPDLKFFQKGNCQKIVIANDNADTNSLNELSAVATIIKIPQKDITGQDILNALEKEGVKSLFVEGGSSILTMFFKENLVNEFRLAIAPFFVGESKAPRLVKEGVFPFGKDNRMYLKEVKKFGDVGVMYFSLK